MSDETVTPEEDGNEGVPDMEGFVDADAVGDELVEGADKAAAANDARPSAENPYTDDDATTPTDDEAAEETT